MQSLEAQGYVTASWVNGQIDAKLAPLNNSIAGIQTDINSNIRPWISAIDTDLASLESYVYDALWPYVQANRQRIVILEDQIKDIIAPDLTPIENRLDALEAVWDSDMIDKINGLDTRITELQEWVGTSIATLADYVDIELKAVSDDITHIINVSLPTITLKISALEGSISNALLLISERFTVTAIERHAWDWYPEVMAAQWLGIYRGVFPEYKNILKLWLARILE